MIINSSKIIQSINKYVPQEDLELFDNTIGQPLTTFTDTFFNAVIFDTNKFMSHFRFNTRFYNISLYDFLLQEYGQDFLDLFKRLTSRPFNAIGVILD